MGHRVSGPFFTLDLGCDMNWFLIYGFRRSIPYLPTGEQRDEFTRFDRGNYHRDPYVLPFPLQ